MLYSPSAHSTGASSGFFFADDNNAPADSFPVSPADQNTAINLPAGSTYSFSPPISPATVGTLTVAAPTAAWIAAQAAAATAATWTAYQATAQAALTESDKTILRCGENAVVVPAAWATYRKTLRAIIAATSGDPTAPLPTRPAYPAGT